MVRLSRLTQKASPQSSCLLKLGWEGESAFTVIRLLSAPFGDLVVFYDRELQFKQSILEGRQGKEAVGRKGWWRNAVENPSSHKWPALSPFKVGSVRDGSSLGAGEGRTRLLSK